MGVFTGCIITCCGCPDDQIKGDTKRQATLIALKLGWREAKEGAAWWDWLCPVCGAKEAERLRDIKEAAPC